MQKAAAATVPPKASQAKSDASFFAPSGMSSTVGRREEESPQSSLLV